MVVAQNALAHFFGGFFTGGRRNVGIAIPVSADPGTETQEGLRFGKAGIITKQLVAEFLPKSSCQIIDGALQVEARILTLDLGCDRGLTDLVGEPQSLDGGVDRLLRSGTRASLQKLPGFSRSAECD